MLLNRFAEVAEAERCKIAFVEAHEGKTLPELLAPSIRSICHSLSVVDGAKEVARRGLRALKGFMSGLKVTVSDMDFGLSIDAESGLADSGDLETDLPALISAVGEAAKAARRPFALMIDELQYLNETEFSALIMSIHRCNQRSLPVLMIGAGLPQITALAGNSKSYSERLFKFPEIGALGRDEAVQAIQRPAGEEGVEFSTPAIDKILEATERYPYFLQQWAYEAWNVSEDEVITGEAVDRASLLAVAELDQSFFKVRLDRCTPSERRYMRALASFGAGKHRSGDVAKHLRMRSTSAAPIRDALIKKGMIYSPSHGNTAFTVPLFDQYMMRVMPDEALGRGTD